MNKELPIYPRAIQQVIDKALVLLSGSENVRASLWIIKKGDSHTLAIHLPGLPDDLLHSYLTAIQSILDAYRQTGGGDLWVLMEDSTEHLAIPTLVTALKDLDLAISTTEKMDLSKYPPGSTMKVFRGEEKDFVGYCKREPFVVIEGLDGCGKGSVIEALKAIYTNAHYTRCPGGSEAGELIRPIAKNGNLEPLSQLYAFAIGNLDNWGIDIKRAKKAGRMVISDRFVESMIGYQAIPNNLLPQTRDVIRHYVMAYNPPKVDLSIRLKLSMETSEQRRIQGGNEDDRYARFTDKQKRAVSKAYDTLYGFESDSMLNSIRSLIWNEGVSTTIDCDGLSVQEIVSMIVHAINHWRVQQHRIFGY